MDFDDPNYHMTAVSYPPTDAFIPQPKGTNPRTLYYDFNELGGGALPREGIDGRRRLGWSADRRPDGSNRNVVVAVLTGSSRMMAVLVSTARTPCIRRSFPFWEEIVQNNPYKYVSAKAGDADWFDPTHWVQDMDPNYAVIGADGNLVNSVPEHSSGWRRRSDRPSSERLCFLGVSCSSIDACTTPADRAKARRRS